MNKMETRNLDSPDETRKFQANGHVDVITLGGFTLGRGTFEPGWKWSSDVKPIAGTASCMTRHTGVCVSGQMTVRSDDGTEVNIGAGDVFVLEPGHDAWTVGDAPCVMFDTGVAAYAKPAS
jgi:EutQ-like cupin domain